jgi:hypothetical protein
VGFHSKNRGHWKKSKEISGKNSSASNATKRDILPETVRSEIKKYPRKDKLTKKNIESALVNSIVAHDNQDWIIDSGATHHMTYFTRNH